MPALNFQKQFAAKVEDGSKPHTFRVEGKRRPPRVGETLSLYTGMRTKGCRLIKRVPCVAVQRMTCKLVKWHAGRCVLKIDGAYRTLAQKEAFAIADGFESWAAFVAWLSATHATGTDMTVRGWLIWWGHPENIEGPAMLAAAPKADKA